MSQLGSSFRVETAVVSLKVTVVDEVVREIRLNATANRGPAGDIERRVARELQEYGSGERQRFSFPISASGSPFDRLVWDALLSIPYGETRSYGQVAAQISDPGAAQAVGAANHRNPIPLVIPCHRVIGSDGSLVGFGGGLELKRRLLELEGVLTQSLI